MVEVVVVVGMVVVVSLGELGMEVSWVLVLAMGVAGRRGGWVSASDALQLVVGEQPWLHRRGGRRQARGAPGFFPNRVRGRAAAAAASVVVMITGGGGRSCIIGHVQFLVLVVVEEEEALVLGIIQAAAAAVRPVSEPGSGGSPAPSRGTPRVELLAQVARQTRAFALVLARPRRSRCDLRGHDHCNMARGRRGGRAVPLPQPPKGARQTARGGRGEQKTPPPPHTHAGGVRSPAPRCGNTRWS